MATYISWFNQTRTAAVREGVTIEGLVHKASPVKNKSGKDWRKGECPKCGSRNGFVFRSHCDLGDCIQGL